MTERPGVAPREKRGLVFTQIPAHEREQQLGLQSANQTSPGDKPDVLLPFTVKRRAVPPPPRGMPLCTTPARASGERPRVQRARPTRSAGCVAASQCQNYRTGERRAGCRTSKRGEHGRGRGRGGQQAGVGGRGNVLDLDRINASILVLISPCRFTGCSHRGEGGEGQVGSLCHSLQTHGNL